MELINNQILSNYLKRVKKWDDFFGDKIKICFKYRQTA